MSALRREKPFFVEQEPEYTELINKNNIFRALSQPQLIRYLFSDR